MKPQDMDTMFHGYLFHMVPCEAQSTPAPNNWSIIHGYIRRYLRVSHLYMIQDALRDPPRPGHQDILKEKHTIVGHVVDVLPKCCCIMEGHFGCHDRGGTDICNKGDNVGSRGAVSHTQ